MKFHSFLIKYGEIGIKGKNRYIFEDALVRQIRYALQGVDGEFLVHKCHGRVYVDCDGDYDFDETVESLQKVFGIVGICPVVRVPVAELAQLRKDVVAYVDEAYEEKNMTFKVDARRAKKSYPANSMEINCEVGEAILEAFPEMKVDVHKPELRINVEIREEVYIYSRIIPGPGGMPIGTNGSAMLLLSGGIDSPVAGYMMAKRGVQIEGLHFESMPYTSDRAREKVVSLAQKMTEYCGDIRLHVLSVTHIQEELMRRCEQDYFTLLLRRFMMRLANLVAARNHCLALITGESLGQVASQTIQALSVTNALAEYPVFRPCIGMDKEEIITVARKIDTFDLSVLPYEDCCTVFTPRHPRTRPEMAKVQAQEEKVDVLSLQEEALSTLYTIDVKR